VASSLLASTQSSPLPADLLSSSYVIHFSTTWWLHTVSMFRSFFPPTFLVYYHIRGDSSFCVFASLQDCFFLFTGRAQQRRQMMGLSPFFFMFRILFPLWKIISEAYEISFILHLLFLLISVLLSWPQISCLHFKIMYVLSSLPLPPDLPC